MPRQGDVLLTERKRPSGARRVRRAEQGFPGVKGIVLAAGEATGHHHVVTDPYARLYATAGGERFLHVSKRGAMLVHEEHDPIELNAGDYAAKGDDVTHGKKKALIAVDVQRDFLPGGALAVPDGDRVIEPLVREMRTGSYDIIFCSRDWHPPEHCSFVTRGGPWPVHCVAYTPGAELHQALFNVASASPRIINKAIYADADAYSAFDNTGLAGDLRQYEVTEVVVGGLATDYCVRATVLGALSGGFAATVLVDAIAAVDPDAEPLVLAEMANAGAVLTTTYALERSVWE